MRLSLLVLLTAFLVVGCTGDGVVKTYDNATQRLVVTQDGVTMVDVQLLTPINYPVPSGTDVEVARLRFYDFNKSVNQLVDRVDFYDVKKDMSRKDGKAFRLKIAQNVSVPESCEGTGQNRICHPAYTYTQWVNLTSLSQLPPTYPFDIALYTDATVVGDITEWIPVIAGTEVREWATYEVLNGTTVTSAAETNITISAVNRSQCFPLFTVTSDNAGTPQTLFLEADLANDTTLRFRRYGTNPTTVSWFITCDSDMTVQSGRMTTPLTTTATMQATLSTPVNLSSTFLVCSSSLNTATLNQASRAYWRCYFHNTTVVNATRGATGTLSDVTYHAVNWNGATVQSGTISPTSAEATATITAVNTSQTFLIASTQTSTATVQQATVRTRLVNATTVGSYRMDSSAGTVSVTYFAINDSDIIVQSGLYGAPADQNLNNVTINSVIINATFATMTWAGGATGSASDLDSATTTISLSNTTTAQFRRDFDRNDLTNTSWYVVEFQSGTPPSGLCSGTSDCTIDCSTTSSVTTSEDVGGFNVYFDNTGTLSVTGSITNFATAQSLDGCTVYVNNGGYIG